MTVSDMHIHLDLLCQELNSNIYSNLQPEEKDIILNKATIRFIREVTTPQSNKLEEGFEYTQARYDDVEELLTPAVLPSYKYTDAGNFNEAVFSVLPQDYLRLVRIRSLVKDLCGASYDTSVEVTSTTIPYFLVDFSKLTGLFSTFVIKMTRSAATTTIFNIDDYSIYSSGFTENSEKFVLIPVILEKLKEKFESLGYNYQVYYEHYDNIYKPNNFIFVADSLVTEFKFEEGENISASVNKTTVLDKITNSFTNFGNATHRLVKSNDAIKLLETSFGTTIPKSPISEIENTRLISYHQKKFIIGNVIIQYIRKPRLININLNIGCELNDNIHDKIVDIAARMIANYSNKGTQKQVMMESLLKE